MDLPQLFDIILHLDKSLGLVIQQYGPMIYLILFLVIFCETGLVVLPFLPGDSLLFLAGAFCASGALNVWLLSGLLILAAVTGNTLNYWIGGLIGDRVFSHHYRWLNQDALRKSHSFYEKHGGKTIVMARFIPLVRTFAPFVAGVARMTFARFQFFNIVGAVLWAGGLVAAGYFFGNMPLVQRCLNTIILIGLALALIPIVLALLWKLLRPLLRRR
ncbi:VTT domain-containing protein [Herbaspirillum sp. RTI4]|uniref:VTT domain-containing protein n=1 Tax=Herbaspirillum sp. RTI4 TaxID=3048640 RepID=UPI002AB37745|nr:VTT domain-containing protein [Herbaspirillum sp. RTI4]MDY7580071.1 VTT domain-containing protein [Herbaspirillum sp. RTI4]MEA9983298.1 VTT domain-containing protein [Herbaspirillum sp. RTI4]